MIKKILNRKARHDYSISHKFEAGIVLSGVETKAIRLGKVDISRAYVKIINREPFLVGALIDIGDTKPSESSKKLLMHKSEIETLLAEIKGSRLTLIPLKIYNKGRRIKLEVGLARSKKKFEKKAESKKKALEREAKKDLKV